MKIEAVFMARWLKKGGLGKEQLACTDR